MILRLLLLFAGFLVFMPAGSQSLVRSALGTAGSTVFSDGILLRYTAGQSSPTEVFTTDDGTLRQGFQQPVDHPLVTFSPPFGEDHSAGTLFALYPNPARDVVYLEHLGGDAVWEFSVTGLYGRMVYQRRDIRDRLVSLTLGDIGSGVWFVTAVSGTRIVTMKLVVL